jgi:hypothetical protein
MYSHITLAAFAALSLSLAACAQGSGTILSGFLGGESKPPHVAPFELPTFDGEKRNHRDYIPPLVPSPEIDADALYKAALNCYPGPSKWRIDVGLEAGYRLGGVHTLDDTEIGGHYVGIVARMPIYSVTELDREREREYRRRTETAKLVGELIQAVAKRNAAHRMLGLYSALESRSQVRVQRGIVDSGEQVGYLEKVSTAYEQLIMQRATITEKRLALVSLCRPSTAPALDEYLQVITALPKLQPEFVPVQDERMAGQ